MIGEFLEQSVTITPKAATAFDKWGTPQAGTPVSASARVQGVEQRIQTAPDTFVDISLIVWLGADESIENNDLVTFGGTGYRVIKVDNKYDIDGTLEHVKVYCK